MLLESCCCCLPTPLTLSSGGGGGSTLTACGPPASFSVHLCSVLDIVVLSGEDVCCSVVFVTLVGVFLNRVADNICCLLPYVIISVRVPESGVCVDISGEN